MSPQSPKLTRKLRKLVQKPDQFFYDYLGKRLGHESTSFVVVDLDTSDYQIDNGVAVITNPEVVGELARLKATGNGRELRIVWKRV